MKAFRRPPAWSLVLALAMLAACGKTESPDATPAAAPQAAAPAPAVAAPAAPTVNEEIKRLAGEVYVYAYPLVLTEMTRQASHGGINTFEHRRGLPDATATGVANPNADFLYSQAWLDLSKEPVVLSVPDTKKRYYLIALLDGWTNVATSLGKRTIGTEQRDFAIVGPRWKGTLPDTVTEIRSPTELAWLFGRIEVDGKAEYPVVTRLQDQFRLSPLSQFGKKGGRKPAPAPAAGATAAPADAKSAPREQVAQMDPATFFTHVAMLLPGNPLNKDDAPMADKIARLGIVAGTPFDVAKLDPLAAAGVQEGVKAAREAIETAGKRPSTGEVRNGWSINRDVGRWGTDYGRRAVEAWRGLGVNAPEDAIFMAARFDAGGQRFDGNGHYVLHFDKGKAPPADGFWSLSLYNDKQQFAANPLGRYNLGSTDNLKVNADGSIDIDIQANDPGKDANWLPAPKEPFNLILRIYWPKAEVVEGRWAPPGVKRAT